MPKKIAQDIVRQVRELGEEVIKEGARQPVGLIETAAKQIGMLPIGWGEGLAPQPSTLRIEEKKKEEEKELEFWRKRKRELEVRPSQAELEAPLEEIEKQRRLTEEAEKKKHLKEPEAKKPRGLPIGAKRRIEKSMPELVGRRVGG